ncbi:MULTISPECIES: DUF3017 domain-containing protein [unclassified Streptomyces]|uniref:DUF3017 domain-containing protein n=1 Tax=unclassified Streptomyces TaxID=2593676 RepID=UPI0037B72898
MGAGTSPADPAPAGRAADEPGEPAEQADRTEQVDRTDRTDQADRTGAGVPDPADEAAGSTAAEATGRAADKNEDTGPPATAGRPRRSRRFPRFTRDTARPEGGGRAASGDAPAPARQWPLLTVLCAAGLGLMIVVLDSFDQAFRVGVILIGGALIAGAVLRWVVPSVGMLAVRSRFTDLVTYGLMGTLIVLLALVAQPAPWLDVPILEDAVRFTIR